MKVGICVMQEVGLGQGHRLNEELDRHRGREGKVKCIYNYVEI